MQKFTAALLLIFILIFASNMAFAQPDTYECDFEYEDGSYDELGEYSFVDCVEALLEYGETDEAYGWWGDIYSYINDDGDVYYLDEDEEWVYWGNLAPASTTNTRNTRTNTRDTATTSLSLYEVFELAEIDINTFWESAFGEANIDYEAPEIVIVQRGDVRSGCGAVGASTGPVYCSAGNTMYLPLRFMEDQYTRIGDYAVVVIIAHEWGHSVEWQLGYFGEDLYTVETELMADCLAGAYTNYLLNESENAVLEEGDVDEAVTSLFEAGDDLPWFDEQAHGSGEDRMDAFNAGMEEGLDACFEE